MATPGYEAINGSFEINFRSAKGVTRRLSGKNDAKIERASYNNGVLSINGNPVIGVKLASQDNSIIKQIQAGDITFNDTSKHYYIQKDKIDFGIGSRNNGTLNKQIVYLYKAAAAAAAAAAPPPPPPPPPPNQGAKAPLPAVAAQALGAQVRMLNVANVGLPPGLANVNTIKQGKNAIVRLNPDAAELAAVAEAPAAEPAAEPPALVADVNLNDNTRAVALTEALNLSKKGGDQTILQKARLRAVKSITDVVDLYFDNNVLKNGSNANQFPTKAEYDTKMNLVTISTRAFVRVCEAITGLSARSTQEHMNTVFAQLIPIVEYVDNENPTLAGLDALPIEPAPAVGGRRRTKGKGKKATKRRMAKAKAKAEAKTKSRTQRRSTRKNRRS